MRLPALLALSLPLTASATPYAYTLSGDNFVAMMSNPAPTGYDYQQREKAYSYLDGVRDSAEGNTWCDVNVLKTPDLAYEVAANIARQPPTERKKNASLLILDQLKRMFPCRVSGGKQ
jgi:hypothetical protein